MFSAAGFCLVAFLCLASCNRVILGVADSFENVTLAPPPASSPPPPLSDSNASVIIDTKKLLDLIESLPNKVVSGLLDEDAFNAIVDRYEDAIFSLDVVSVKASEFRQLFSFLEAGASPSFLHELQTMVVAGGEDVRGRPLGPPLTGTARSTPAANNGSTFERLFPSCLEAGSHELTPRGETLIFIRLSIFHPVLDKYRRRQWSLSRLLRHPFLTRKIHQHQRQVMKVLFLDFTFASVVETKILCYDFAAQTNNVLNVQVGFAFEKSLDAMELSTIQNRLVHIPTVISDASINMTFYVHFRSRNLTSPVFSVSGFRPCAFFDLLEACRNGGACVGFTGVGNCKCVKGFEGRFCDVEFRGSASVDSVAARWHPWIYMLAGVVVVSFSTVAVVWVVKSCRRRKKGGCHHHHHHVHPLCDTCQAAKPRGDTFSPYHHHTSTPYHPHASTPYHPQASTPYHPHASTPYHLPQIRFTSPSLQSLGPVVTLGASHSLKQQRTRRSVTKPATDASPFVAFVSPPPTATQMLPPEIPVENMLKRRDAERWSVSTVSGK